MDNEPKIMYSNFDASFERRRPILPPSLKNTYIMLYVYDQQQLYSYIIYV